MIFSVAVVLSSLWAIFLVVTCVQHWPQQGRLGLVLFMLLQWMIPSLFVFAVAAVLDFLKRKHEDPLV